MTALWYGATAAWWAPLERDARRADGDRLQVELGHRRLTYRHTGIEVPGRRELVPVRIEFFADPPYYCYGLPPQDYPRVFADPGQPSPHRMPDDSLCLFYPADPPEKRWRSEDGLLSLLGLARDHLFFELHWRATGAHHGGVWLGVEAAHGFPEVSGSGNPADPRRADTGTGEHLHLDQRGDHHRGHQRRAHRRPGRRHRLQPAAASRSAS